MIGPGDDVEPTGGRLVYRTTEHSLIFLDRAPDIFGGGLVALDMLPIEIDVSDGRLQLVYPASAS